MLFFEIKLNQFNQCIVIRRICSMFIYILLCLWETMKIIIYIFDKIVILLRHQKFSDGLRKKININHYGVTAKLKNHNTATTIIAATILLNCHVH